MKIECAKLSDEELCEHLRRLVAAEKESLVGVLECLIEFDARRVHEKMSSPTLFTYCVRTLGYSESAAGKRIYAARAAKRFPLILELLQAGKIHLEAIVVLGPHLNEVNFEAALREACGRTVREIEWIVARLSPRPDSPNSVRRLPESTAPMGRPADTDPAVARAATPNHEGHGTTSDTSTPQPLYMRQTIRPTAPERVRFAFTAGEELLALLHRAQDVLRHKYPAGDLEKIFFEALEALLDDKDPERKLRAKEERAAAGHEREPRPPSVWAFAQRHIPQSVRDAVWRRDGGQCVYREGGGQRCPERGGLEFDHVIPFSLGGPSNNPKNIRLLCKAHNLMMARQTLGTSALRHQNRGSQAG